MTDREPLISGATGGTRTNYGLRNPVDNTLGTVQCIASIQVQSTPPGRDVKSTYRLYLKRTIFLYLGYLCLGMNVGEGGSTFLDLLLLVKTDVEKGSIYYTAGSIGYAFGAVLAGQLYDMLNRDGLLFLALFFMGSFNIAISWCPSLWLMASVNAFRGATFGSLDTGGNTVCVWMWKDEGSPYLQALHMSFSIGGVIAPFISEPFLAPKDNTTNSTGRHLNMAYAEYEDNKSVSIFNMTHAEAYTHPETHVQFAYLIIGSITILCSLPFLVLFCMRSRIQPLSEIKAADDKTVSVETSVHPNLSLPERIMFLCFLGVFYMFYVSLEANIEGYLMTFVVKYLDWSKPEGSRITSVFWGTFAAGRLLGVLTSKFLTPWKMLLIDLVLVNGVLVPLWFLSRENDVIAWVCFPLAGLFMATIFPTGISWTDQNIMRVSGRIASIFILSSTIGGIFLPMLLGYLFKNITPMWFVYLLTIEAGICFLMFITLTSLLAVYRRKSRTLNLVSKDNIKT